MHIWKSNVRASQLNVQETNFGFAQFHKIWSHFSGCWTTYGWVICSWFLGFSNWTKHTSPQENWGSSWFPNQDPACHRKYFLQDKQFRISCRSRVICQFWKHFVFYFATTGIVGIGCTLVSGNWAASSSSSGSVFERSGELATRRLGQESLTDDKKDADDPLADLPIWVRGFHR